ncbi:MAG TPA: MFS transporter [Steroidobacteraceae bacterium]|nr:MFS transporter [Steroidobacteraceae bacterium]
MTGGESRASEFARGWKALLAATLGVACGASPVPFNAIGAFLGPFNKELGWSFRNVSLGITLFGVTAACLAPLYGSWADRYGVRRVALLSLAAFGVAFAAFALTPASLPGFYALWLLLGLVGIGSTPVTWSRAVNLWFVRRRGLALGILLMGTSLTVIVVPPLTVYAIRELGWRPAFVVLSMLPLLVALPIAYFLFREPTAAERPRELSTADGHALLGESLRVAMRGRRFWIIFASILVVAFAYGGAHVHMVEMLGLKGLAREDAAKVMGVLGASIFVGRIATGLLLDRYWAPLVTLPILCLPAVSCWLLSDDSITMATASAAGIFLGFAAGAETDLIAYLAGRYFGMAHYGKIYGSLYMPFGIASAVSPAVYGWVRDSTGNYDAMLGVAAVMFVAGGLVLLALGRYPDFRPG